MDIGYGGLFNSGRTNLACMVAGIMTSPLKSFDKSRAYIPTSGFREIAVIVQKAT